VKSTNKALTKVIKNDIIILLVKNANKAKRQER